MPKKNAYNEHVLQIKQALQENRLAIFIGAGFSKAANDKYPSWKTLIDTLKEDIPKVQVTDFLQIAEHYKLKYKNKTKEKIKRIFPSQDSSSELHKKLLELYPHYIITTNWDNMLEVNLEEKKLTYDIIVEDKDLQLSTHDYKIIKMHGDFNHDNFVFTESDYLNYSQNFPLIEAYLKGIFTTHTILFLGYGFGDTNLKLIITWLQNNSKNNKLHYMFVTEKSCNRYNKKYYSKYGITLLPKKNYNGNYFSQKDYEDFFNQLTSEEIELEHTTPEYYIYNKLKPLENLNHVLFFQIIQALTNCNILISNQGVLIQLYDQIVTNDYDKTKREIYKKFYLDLKNKITLPSTIQQKIITILQKAFINGIYYGDDFYPSDSCLFPHDNSYFTENLKKLLSFDYTKQQISSNNEIQQLLYNMVCFYNLSKYEEALTCCEEIMNKALLSMQYAYYFISVWNYNTILYGLKSYYIPNDIIHKKKLLWENPYQNYKEKNIKNIYNRLPSSFQQSYKYITTEWINYTLTATYNTLSDIREKITKINNGTLFFTNIIPLDYHSHQNLIFFILENGILMEKNKSFNQICKNYFKIGLFRKKINDQGKIELFLIEIYSAIKYFNTTELEYFFRELSDDNTQFSTTEDILNIIINDIFSNCLTVYSTFHSHDFVKYLSNILFILGHFQLSEEKFKNIIDKINKTIISTNNHLYFFEAINNFYIAQYKLCTQKLNFPITEIFNGITELLYKYINGKIGTYECETIKNNLLYNIYNIATSCKYYYDNKNLLEQIIIKNKKYDIKEQISIISSVLINLYPISNKECCDIIDNYIEQTNKIIIKEELNIDIIYYELLLINHELNKISNERISQYINYIEEFNPKVYDSRINMILSVLEKIKKKNNGQFLLPNQFDKLYNLVKNAYEIHNEGIKNLKSYI